MIPLSVTAPWTGIGQVHYGNRASLMNEFFYSSRRNVEKVYTIRTFHEFSVVLRIIYIPRIGLAFMSPTSCVPLLDHHQKIPIVHCPIGRYSGYQSLYYRYLSFHRAES